MADGTTHNKYIAKSRPKKIEREWNPKNMPLSMCSDNTSVSHFPLTKCVNDIGRLAENWYFPHNKSQPPSNQTLPFPPLNCIRSSCCNYSKKTKRKKRRSSCCKPVTVCPKDISLNMWWVDFGDIVYQQWGQLYKLKLKDILMTRITRK